MAHFPPDADSDRDGNPAILGEFLGSSVATSSDLDDAAVQVAAGDSESGWTSSDTHDAAASDAWTAQDNGGTTATAFEGIGHSADDSLTLASSDSVTAYDELLFPAFAANHPGSGGYWTPYTAPDTVGAPPDAGASNIGDTGFHNDTATGPAEPVLAPTFVNGASAAHTNTPPVVSINHPFAPTGEWSNVGTWVDYADADGNPAVLYQFRDSNAAANSAYLSTPDNAHWAANTDVTVAAANLDDVRVHAGGANTSDIMWVRAFDGTNWSDWAEIAFRTDTLNMSSGVTVTLAISGADTAFYASTDTLSSGTISTTTGAAFISGHPLVITIDPEHLIPADQSGSASHFANSLLV